MNVMLDHAARIQRMREIIDSPWRERPVWFWFLSPVLLLVASLWSFVAKVRRLKGYARFPAGHRPLVICCGNVSLGGTGKSPIVRALARDFLAAGFPVAVVTRGVGESEKELLCSVRDGRTGGHYGEASLVSPVNLGDEAREHFELLSHSDGKLLIIQGRNRQAAVSAFCRFLESFGALPSRGVCLLDDGLQTFSAARHLNLCVWSPGLLASAPTWSPPIGPYRETGIVSFSELLSRFDFRIWSRAADEETVGDFKALVRKALERFGTDVDVEHDLLAVGEPWARSVRWDADGWSWEGASEKLQVALSRLPEGGERVLLLHGIAYGRMFACTVRAHLGVERTKLCREVTLGDHGELTASAIRAISDAQTVICTAKDFFRWIGDNNFLQAMDGRRLVVCGMEVALTRIDGSRCRMSEILKYRSDMKDVEDAN